MSANSEIFETRGNVQTTTQKTSFQEGKRADFALDFPRDFRTLTCESHIRSR